MALHFLKIFGLVKGLPGSSDVTSWKTDRCDNGNEANHLSSLSPKNSSCSSVMERKRIGLKNFERKVNNLLPIFFIT